jgi:hypothetical protein
MNRYIKTIAVSLMALAMLFGPTLQPADAIVSAVSSVQLSYVVGESLTITGVPPSLTFTGSPIPATGPLSVTTTWVLTSSRSRVDIALFFQTPSAALTDGAGDNIPSSQVFANINGGTFSACNSSAVAPELSGSTVSGGICGANANTAITTANDSGNRTDSFVFQLQGLGALPAATYTGQINLIAGAN